MRIESASELPLPSPPLPWLGTAGAGPSCRKSLSWSRMGGTPHRPSSQPRMETEGGDTLQQTCKRGWTRFDEVVQYLEKVYPALKLCFLHTRRRCYEAYSRIVKPRQASIACLSCSDTSRYAAQGQGQGAVAGGGVITPYKVTKGDRQAGPRLTAQVTRAIICSCSP